MTRGARFVDVLDDKLRASGWEASARDEFRSRPVPPPHVVYTPLYTLHTVTQRVHAAVADAEGDAYRHTASPAPDADITGGAFATPSQADTRHRTSEPPQPPVERTEHAAEPAATPPAFRVFRAPAAPPRSRRRLTALQWRALDSFNRLGAGVSVDFSASELRSTFRRLARRYHPDRHPGASEPERQRLSREFTTLRNSYDTLLTALDRPSA
jgi:hypothetical protein